MSPKSEPVRIYRGASMKRVFRDGDLIETRPIAFEEFRRGDVICFTMPGTSIEVVHRVVAVTAEGLRTRGDNNRSDDAAPVTGAAHPMLVEAYRRGRGNRRRVARGKTGFRHYRLNQFRRNCRQWCAARFGPMLKSAPLARLGKWFGPLTPYRFGESEFLYAGKRPIARRIDGAWRIQSPLLRLFFAATELDRNYPEQQK